MAHPVRAYGPPGTPADAEHSRSEPLLYHQQHLQTYLAQQPLLSLDFTQDNDHMGGFQSTHLHLTFILLPAKCWDAGQRELRSVWGKKNLQTLLADAKTTDPFFLKSDRSTYLCTKFIVWWSPAKGSFGCSWSAMLQALEVEIALSNWLPPILCKKLVLKHETMPAVVWEEARLY